MSTKFSNFLFGFLRLKADHFFAIEAGTSCVTSDSLHLKVHLATMGFLVALLFVVDLCPHFPGSRDFVRVEIALNRRPCCSPLNFNCCHDKLNPNWNNSPNFMQMLDKYLSCRINPIHVHRIWPREPSTLCQGSVMEVVPASHRTPA